MSGEDSTHAHECAHDLDVDQGCSLAAQDTGQHGHALFREGERLIANVTFGCGHRL